VPIITCPTPGCDGLRRFDDLPSAGDAPIVRTVFGDGDVEESFRCPKCNKLIPWPVRPVQGD
jgi:hypothetical protein